MKYLSLAFYLIMALTCLQSRAQTAYDPKILILAPGNFTFDPGLKKEVELKNAELKMQATQAQQNSSTQKDKENDAPANARLMQQSTVGFVKTMDFAKQISVFAQQYLAYQFFEKFPNCLILVKDETAAGNIESLQKIAAAENMPYLLNFSAMSLYKQNGETYCKIKVQLFEQQSNKLLIDKEYTGDWNNPGFEFSCDQGSIGCTLNNALSFVMPDVIFQVASNNPTLIKEKALAIKRSEVVANTIFPQKFNSDLVNQVVSANDKSIDLNNLYQCFYSPDNSKFVAFFIKTLDPKDKKKLLDAKSDVNVTVLTSKDIKDPGYLDQAPGTYAFIVRGVQYQNKWYIEKSEVTYFDAANLKEGEMVYLNNLQKWSFFNEDTAEPGVGFWDGELFEKVTDKRKDSDWEKYKDMWEMEERENRDYIGLFTIVADKLKKENELADNEFRKQAADTLLLPFYTRETKLKLNNFASVDTAEAENLIYPKDKYVILNALRVTDEKGIIRIRYFVFIVKTREVFEWTLVTPSIIKKDDYTNDLVIKTIGALTSWDYSYKTLDDNAFWNEKVLAKENGNYKYLVKLQ